MPCLSFLRSCELFEVSNWHIYKWYRLKQSFMIDMMQGDINREE
jgi:hypothetical protein